MRVVRRKRALAERHPAGPSAPPVPRPAVPPDPAERDAIAERLLCAFELLDAGLFDWDVASGRVDYFMPGFPATKPVATARVSTADEWFEATHPDDLAIASAGVDRALRGEAERFSMFYRRLRGGEWRYVQAEGKVFARGEDGRARRVIGTYRDVTEPVRREEGRHAREASTRHAQFRATLTEFASSLAHELNQPLAALSTNVQAALRLLEEGRRGGREVLAALGRSVVLAERAADVVRAMRQLVQPESRAEEEFDLRTLVRETRDLLAAEARRADVVLRAAPASGSIVVSADPRQVELVLLNLVRNAIEAIVHAGAKRRIVTVRTRRLPAAVRLEVEDTGPGVDPAVRGRIFDAYFTTKEGGTGLGLRLCRTFAEAHGGRLECAPPRPRKGALFILELPASRSSSHGPREPAGPAVRRGRARRG